MIAVSPESMQAACEAAIALERARGVPLPEDEEADLVYAVGFAAGAQWAIDMIKELKSC